VEPVRFSVVGASSAEARWALTQYFDELARRFPGGFVAEGALDEAAATYTEPSGSFLVGTEGDETVACGALVLLDATTAEIKRMWVSAACRGRGIGRRLLQRLEDEARSAGRTTVVLDTNGSLTEAIALYEASGYTRIARYNDNPYAEHWFTKPLPG
jgi:ribosomal protein S18 acetylase RimI-like enzyme